MSNVVEITTIEDLIPYMDETPISADGLEELDFKRIEISVEESGADKPFVYYEYEIFPDNPYDDLALLSDEVKEGGEITSVTLFPHDKPVFKTMGGVKTILMGLQGE